MADAIGQQVAGKRQIQPFRYRNKGNLATVGRAFGVVDMGPVHLAGFFAWIMWLSVHIAYLIGFRNRLLVLLQWAWAYVTHQKSARLMTCGPTPSPWLACAILAERAPEKSTPTRSTEKEPACQS